MNADHSPAMARAAGVREKRRRSRGAILAAAGLALAALAGFATAARAELLGISATGFVLHCPCAVDPSDESLERNGVLQITRQNSRFYSAVVFPKNGDKVCSFSLVYRDVNGNDAIRARLFKKTFAVGGPAFGSPVVMATASSAPGVSDTVRQTRTTSINQPAINKANAFYYVLVDAPTINLAFLGVQIDVRATCP
jgi:hypothetical protein